MLYRLSNDIVSTFCPKNTIRAVDELPKDMREKLKLWQPIEEVNLNELDRILTETFCMEQYILPNKKIIALSEDLVYENVKHKYISTYTFKQEDDWRKWALPDELFLADYLDNIRKNNIAKYLKEKRTVKADETLSALNEMISQEEYNHWLEKHKLVHILSTDGVGFHDIRVEGDLPSIILYSLFHLLGKAPIPEETYSEWYMYLQFLIDIGYVKEV